MIAQMVRHRTIDHGEVQGVVWRPLGDYEFTKCISMIIFREQ